MLIAAMHGVEVLELFIDVVETEYPSTFAHIIETAKRAAKKMRDAGL